MKIALIHSIYKPYFRGGAEVVVDNIVSGLKKRSENFFVISLGYQDKKEELGGVSVYRIKPSNLFNFLDILNQPAWKRFFWHIFDVFNFVQAWKIYKILKEEKPDLVFTHSLKGIGYLTLKVISLLKIKNIHTIHDMQLISPTGLLPKKSLSFFERNYLQICKGLFGSPETVIFPSEFVKNIYQNYGFFKKSKNLVIFNPIIPQENLPTENKKDPELVFAYIGQVEEYKGILDLLEALKMVSGQWKLKVVGIGKDLEKVKLEAKNMPQVEFLGHLGRDELKKIWTTVNVLVNPSQVSESFGMTILEANSFGIPALVSKIGAFTELVGEKETGWFFEPKNISDLAEKLNFLLAHSETVLSLRQNCLAKANDFSIDNYLDRILAI